MPIQVVGTTTPRLDLGVALDEFNGRQNNFIADQVLPITPVPQKKFVADVFERASQAKDVSNLNRGPGGDYSRDTAATSEMSVSCKERGLEFQIDDSEARNYATRFDYEYYSALTIMRRILIRRERAVASAVFNTTTFTGSSLYLDTANVWSATTTDILADIDQGREYIRLNGMVEPNFLVVSAKTFQYMLNNDAIVAASVYTQGAAMQTIANSMAAYLGLDAVLVGRQVYSSGGESSGNTYTGAAIWSNSYAFLGYRPTTASIQENCLGRTFLWTEDSPTITTVEQYRDDARRSDIIRVRHCVDEKIIDTACGFLFKID